LLELGISISIAALFVAIVGVVYKVRRWTEKVEDKFKEVDAKLGEVDKNIALLIFFI